MKAALQELARLRTQVDARGSSDVTKWSQRVGSGNGGDDDCGGDDDGGDGDVVKNYNNHV